MCSNAHYHFDSLLISRKLKCFMCVCSFVLQRIHFAHFVSAIIERCLEFAMVILVPYRLVSCLCQGNIIRTQRSYHTPMYLTKAVRPTALCTAVVSTVV